MFRRWTRTVAATTVALTLVAGGSALAEPAAATTTRSASTLAATSTPSRVTGLRLLTLPSGNVTVKWAKARNAQTYTLQVGFKSYTVKGLRKTVAAPTGTRVRVRAVSSGGVTGAWSESRYAAPRTPRISHVSTSSTGTVAVSWAKVQGALRYEVRAGKRSFETKNLTAKVAANAGTAIRVRAIGPKSTSSGWSGARYRAPLAVTEVKVSAPTSSTARVQWASVTGATRYQLNVSGTTSETTSTSSAVLAFAGERVRVRAEGPGGWGPWSVPILKPLSASEKAELRDELADINVAISHAEAEIATLKADLAKFEYWLMVAQEYGDDLRVQELEAEIAMTNAQMDEVQAELDDLRERKAEIVKLLA